MRNYDPIEHLTMTERLLLKMMKQDTGRHFLDSGGAYGRAWQRNQIRDFLAEPPATVSFRHGSIDFVVNTYHMLTNALDYAPDIDLQLLRYMRKSDDSWLADAEGFLREYLVTHEADHHGHKVYVENTYNNESNLDHTLQYAVLDDIVILSIHLGCDVRGGYGQPRAFRWAEYGGWLRAADGYLVCSGCNENWSTDDTCNWYDDGSSAGTHLENYPFEAGSAGKIGVIVYNEAGEGFCPKCGLGKLEAHQSITPT